MPILTPQQYVENREGYDYTAPNTEVNVFPTFNVGAVRSKGIYPRSPPPCGLSIRQFEDLIQAVFTDCATTQANAITRHQISNLQAVSLALVHWKMSSQHGRADRARRNVLEKWSSDTIDQLMNAFNFHAANPLKPDVGLFQIKGVRIAISSAFLRFLFPGKYGIVDSRVAGRVTNQCGRTNFSLRPYDNYINDTHTNRVEYNTVYTRLLQEEAAWLNGAAVTFTDPDPMAQGQQNWRPCDVEMALWGLATIA